MKDEFDENGTLVIKAENYTEAFALEHWNKGFIFNDLKNEEAKYRSTLKIYYTVNKE